MLLIASCIFYMDFIPKYIVILAVTITIDYLAGIWLERPGLSPNDSSQIQLFSLSISFHKE